MVYAFVITAHGYGHASRAMEILRALLEADPNARAIVLTAAPADVFADYFGDGSPMLARVAVVPYRADVGLVQKDGIAMDRDATLRALDVAWGDPERAESALAEALGAYRPDVVVGDIPPVAFGAAARLRVPSVAVGNFDWAFIYGSYATSDPAFSPWRDLAARWQSHATLAVHLTPGPPLTGFPLVVEGGVVARRLLSTDGARSPERIRESLGLRDGDRAVLVSFGGSGLDDASRRIPVIPGVTWVLAPPMRDLGRADARFVEPSSGVSYLALLGACDAVFTKPGYGIVTESSARRTRMLYTDRGDFPEYPFLVRYLHDNVPVAYVASADLGSPRGPEAIARALDELFAQEGRWPPDGDGGERVAAIVRRVAAGA